MRRTVLVHSDAYKRFDYGPEHPLRMERLGLTYALMEAYGLTRRPGVEVLPPMPVDGVCRWSRTLRKLDELMTMLLKLRDWT